MLGSHAFKITAIVIGVSLAAACAPKDKLVPGGKKDRADAAAKINLEVKSFDDKTPELARHALLQLSHVNRYLDFAFNYRLTERMQMADGASGFGMFDGRRVTKLSPSWSRTTDEAKTEKLQITFDKVEADQFDRSVITNPSINGVEDVVITYDKDYPREGNPKLDLGFPVSIVVLSSPVEVNLLMASGAKITVDRWINLTAARIENTDDFATYLVSDSVSDHFSQDNVGTLVRDGTLKVSLSGFTFKISKAVPHALMEVKPGTVDVAVLGKKMKTSGSRADDPWDRFNVTFSVVATSALSLPATVCAPFAATYQISKDRGVALNMTVADSQLTLDGGAAPLATAVCGVDSEQLNWVSEFASVFP